MLDQLIPAIKDKSLPPKDRLGLQNDLFALVSLLTSKSNMCKLVHTHACNILTQSYAYMQIFFFKSVKILFQNPMQVTATTVQVVNMRLDE